MEPQRGWGAQRPPWAMVWPQLGFLPPESSSGMGHLSPSLTSICVSAFFLFPLCSLITLGYGVCPTCSLGCLLCAWLSMSCPLPIYGICGSIFQPRLTQTKGRRSCQN